MAAARAGQTARDGAAAAAGERGSAAVKARRWIGRWVMLSAAAGGLALPCSARGQAALPAAAPQPAAAAPAAPTPAAAATPNLIDPLAVLRDPAALQNDRDEAARRLILRNTPDA